MEEFESQSEVERMIEELKKANIGFDNYKHFVEKLKSTERVIKAQIENMIREYKTIKLKYDEKIESAQYKRHIEEGVAPKEIIEFLMDMNRILKDSYSWKILENQMYSIVFDKIFTVLDDAKALDIKRDALNEMREMEKNRNQLFLEVMSNQNKMIEEVINTKLSTIDTKFISAISMLMKQSNHEKKVMLSAFSQSINMFSEQKKAFEKEINGAKKVDVDEEERVITKKIEALTMVNKVEKKKKEEDIITTEDDPFLEIDDDE